MAYLTVQLQYGVADDSFPLYPSPFPLFPNVHIRATLAMTHLQSITNENIASLGLQKVGRDTRNISQCRWLYVQFQDSYFFNIGKVFPEPDPPISGEIFSSLRILIPGKSYRISGSHELVKEVKPLLYFKKKLTWFCFLFCADEQPGFRLTWISGAHLNCVNHLSWIEIMGRRGHVAMKMITDMITRLKCLVILITQVFGYKPSEVNRARTSNLREKFGVKVEHPVPHDHWLHCQCLILYPYLDHI